MTLGLSAIEEHSYNISSEDAQLPFGGNRGGIPD